MAGPARPPSAEDTRAVRRDTLRFIACGSVDDGKSTLIGRLLHDAGQVSDDQRAALEADSRRYGTQGDAVDLALLVDALGAEREQGITIDVAYRFFATERRHFVVADTPGHERYTRNMVTGASTADLAVILVDARTGVRTQTRRHAYLVHLLGVRELVLAVNKMDLVGYDERAFAAIVADFAGFAQAIGIARFASVPLSALTGDNVWTPGAAMPWYDGPTLIELLERASPAEEAQAAPLRLPVQWVNRPDADFRGYAGTIAAGTVAPGDAVRILPGTQTSRVARIVTADGDLPQAAAGEAVTLTLADPVDCARGDVIADATDPPQVADRFEATLIWMADTPLLPGRAYAMKLGTRTVSATVQPPKYRIDVNTLEHLAAKTLDLNAIGVVQVATDRPIVFAPYAESRTLGGFLLIDRTSHATLAAGLVHFALHRSQNVFHQPSVVDRTMRAALKQQRPAVVWLTGLSGAGKSTIADALEQRLAAMGRHTFLLDGDNVRHGLSADLGFTDADRIENIRRVGEVARLMSDAGLIVIAAFISPFAAERDMVRGMMAPGEFLEVHVDTPIAQAEARDVKGLYAKARAGLLPNFTGIDSPYEAPEAPDLRIDTHTTLPGEAADRIVALLEVRETPPPFR